MQDPQRPAHHPIPLMAHLTQAFAAWESGYRADPATFMTPDECAAMAVADISQQRAIYFTALLREASATPLGNILAVGQPWPEQGGHLGAIIGAGTQARAIIVSASAHEITGQWGEYGQDVAATSRTDGAANTAAMAEAGSTIATRVRALQIDGHTDWHIPARDEALALESQAPQLFAKAWHWTSTQLGRDDAFAQGFASGISLWYDKDFEFRVRAVRTIQLQHLTASPLHAEGEASALAVANTPSKA